MTRTTARGEVVKDALLPFVALLFQHERAGGWLSSLPFLAFKNRPTATSSDIVPNLELVCIHSCRIGIGSSTFANCKNEKMRSFLNRFEFFDEFGPGLVPSWGREISHGPGGQLGGASRGACTIARCPGLAASAIDPAARPGRRRARRGGAAG